MKVRNKDIFQQIRRDVANFCGGGFIVEVLGNLSLALILGTAAAVQDDDDDNFTTLIKDPT